MNKLVLQLKKQNMDLKEAEIEGLLYILKNGKNLINNDLITLTGLPKETIKNFKSSVSNFLESPSGDEVTLSKEGAKILEEFDLQPYKWSLHSYNVPEIEQKLVDIRKKYNLQPKREFDQFFATENTSVAKIMALKDKGFIEGKNIALIGDDDLISVVLGLMEIPYASITVFDIDDGILSVIRTISSDLGMKNIQTRIYDVREPMNKEFYGKFDVVITDPPYTKSGITLFLNRALQFLGDTKDFVGKYIFLYYGNSFKSPEKTIKVQEVINNFNLLIEDRIDKFARYNGAESIGSASSLYILKTTKQTKDISDSQIPSEIYTYENQKEEKFPYVDHVVLKVHGVSTAILKSRNTMLKLLGKFCDLHKLKVVDKFDKKTTKFKGEGFSFTFILSNSNLLVHTWPEYNAIHIDLVTCMPVYNKEGLADTVSKLFDTKKIEVRSVE